MRIHSLILAGYLICVACTETNNEQANPVPYQTALAAIQKAQDDAERIHLPEKLAEAQQSVRKLGDVYRDALRLHEPMIAAEADGKIAEIVLPKVRSNPSNHVIQRYLRRIPKGSKTEQTLQSLLR